MWPPMSSRYKLPSKFLNATDHELTLVERLLDMTASRKPFRFSRVNLSDADKETLRRMDVNLSEIVENIANMIQCGYKLTITWNVEDECFVASQIGNRENREDFNLCLTSRAPEFLQAAMTALFKWEVLLASGNLPEPNTAPTGGHWD